MKLIDIVTLIFGFVPGISFRDRYEYSIEKVSLEVEDIMRFLNLKVILF